MKRAVAQKAVFIVVVILAVALIFLWFVEFGPSIGFFQHKRSQEEIIKSLTATRNSIPVSPEVMRSLTAKNKPATTSAKVLQSLSATAQ